jgi:glycosyltransferase involved in cell wall biosynthesis
LVYNKELLGDVFGERTIRTSFLQKIPFSRREHRFFPILMPMAVEQFDLSYYDLVLSDSSSYAKGVITRPGALHICYCHTPMRYAWDDCHKYAREFYYPSWVKRAIPFGMNYVRIWDWAAAKRVDHFIANSCLVKDRIKKYYKAEASVIHPPVSLDNFQVQNKTKDYYLMAGRLVPYKRFDLGVKAFNKLKLPLKIVGSGSELERLKAMAGKNIEFIGSLKSYGQELAKIYGECKALIYPQEEDFGLVPLEAMASGRPVIAFRRGGAKETVKEGITGIFFSKQDTRSLISAVQRFNDLSFDPEVIRHHAEGFSKERFKKEILDFINQKLKDKNLHAIR